MRNRLTHSPAFTLIELAIVIVIIGLLLGAILSGQDLIRIAATRMTIADIERFNSATHTFRVKYDGLPGDLLNTKAHAFGFNTADNNPARNGGARHGDGNGAIQGCVIDYALGCETALFWSDLAKARLIAMFAPLTAITATSQNNLTTTDLRDGVLPRMRLRDTALMTVYSNEGQNAFGIGEMYTNAQGVLLIRDNTAHGLTPMEAQNIDRKMDDSEPTTGTITAYYNHMINPDSAGSPTGCIGSLAAGSHYNTATPELANTDTCSITIRTSF